MKKIKKEDKVIVIAGKDKGKIGTVKKVLAHGAVLVGGINLVKRHTKANPNVGKVAGIFNKESPIDVSNVAIFNSETGKADKVGFKLDQHAKKIRYYKSTGKILENTINV